MNVRNHRVNSSGLAAPLTRVSILILVVMAGALSCGRQAQHTAPATIETHSPTLEVTNTQEDELVAASTPTIVDFYEKVVRHMMGNDEVLRYMGGTNPVTTFLYTDDPVTTASLITLLNEEKRPFKPTNEVGRRPGAGGVFDPSTGQRAQILGVKIFGWQTNSSAMKVWASWYVSGICSERYVYTLGQERGRVTIISRRFSGGS